MTLKKGNMLATALGYGPMVEVKRSDAYFLISAISHWVANGNERTLTQHVEAMDLLALDGNEAITDALEYAEMYFANDCSHADSTLHSFIEFTFLHGARGFA